MRFFNEILTVKMSKITIFLDRDGVINEDSSDYIKSAEEFKFIPKSAEAIALLTQRGFDVIVITNQSGVGRKIFTTHALDAIFDKMKKGVRAAGGIIKDIFLCPHLPEDSCLCRKPLPGLIVQAVDKYKIDLRKSCMVGDSVKDIECAKNAGCVHSVLVRTGNGKKSEEIFKELPVKPDFIADDLMDAVLMLFRLYGL